MVAYRVLPGRSGDIRLFHVVMQRLYGKVERQDGRSPRRASFIDAPHQRSFIAATPLLTRPDGAAAR